MSTTRTPQLLTVGRIAEELGEPIHRVTYILQTRSHIVAVARAGVIRLYDGDAIALIRLELSEIDAKREGKP